MTTQRGSALIRRNLRPKDFFATLSISVCLARHLYGNDKITSQCTREITGATMADYFLFLYDDPTGWTKLSPEEMQKALEKYIGWSQKATNAGFLRGSHRLAEDTGKVIRGAKVTDGPYSETKEILGGYFLIEADSYDQAVQRSLDHPHLEYGGTIEIRQVHPMHEQK
jgi:hypothetical protein